MKNAVRYQFYKTEKFKTTTISIRFLRPLKEKEASINAMLSQSLVDRCAKYHSKQLIANALDELYGAGLGSSINGFGEAQTLELRFKFMNPKFANNKEEFEQEIVNFIKEIIFYPLLTEEVFQEAKKVLIAKIKRMLDDPQSYASNKALKIAGGSTSVAISNYGDLDTVLGLTFEDFLEGYQTIVNASMVDVLVVGNIDDSFENQLRSLPFSNQEVLYPTYQKANLAQYHQVIENKHIPQSVIQMVFNTGVCVADEDYMNARIMNAMLGVFPTSLLFQEVREKHSLCYSIYSSLIGFDGIMQISTGVKDENIKQTIELIEAQVERLKNGEFTEELLEVTKRMMVNTFKGINDDPNSTINLGYQSLLSGVELYNEQTTALINKVTKEDVVKAANQLGHVLTFVLTKDENYGKAL